MLIARLVWECSSKTKAIVANRDLVVGVVYTTCPTVTVSDGPADISISPTVRGSAITMLPNNPSHDRACALHSSSPL